MGKHHSEQNGEKERYGEKREIEGREDHEHVYVQDKKKKKGKEGKHGGKKTVKYLRSEEEGGDEEISRKKRRGEKEKESIGENDLNTPWLMAHEGGEEDPKGKTHAENMDRTCDGKEQADIGKEEESKEAGGEEGHGSSNAFSTLVMDEKMHAARKADKKERHWAQTSLRKACRLKDVKFFNKLISEFGNAKQMGFALQVCAYIYVCKCLLVL